MIKSIVIGASFGGMEAIRVILSALPEKFPKPIAVVLHIGSNNISTYLSILKSTTSFNVKEAAEKTKLKSGKVYFAPPNYHLQLEDNFTFSLSTDSKVNYSRPSIDVLFETAAWSLKNEVLGVLLTGSNNDGAKGLETIKKYGGITIVQNPKTALAKSMPQFAINLCQPDFILNLEDIADKIADICAK